MTKVTKPKCWIFSNKYEGYYDDSIWDMSTTLHTALYSIRENERNRRHVKPGDCVYMRIYNDCFIGKFTIAGNWKSLPTKEQKWDCVTGQFPIQDVILWDRPVPQTLILPDLSNHDYRSRIVSATNEDGIMIETAQRVYSRLGFGSADGEFVILEEGLEEAIKPNLKQMGLRLAGKSIQQQFSMGPGVGRSDLICTDKKDNLVVIELKRGMTSDRGCPSTC